MQMVYIKSPQIADELQSMGYQLSKNQALRIDGAFCFEADRKLVELLKSAYNKADYIIDPLHRYGRKRRNNETRQSYCDL